ncbi:MAG: metallophosphoesterase [Candidatus Cryptobacteroides sp.]
MRNSILSLFLLLASAAVIRAQEPFGIIHGPYLQNVTSSEATIVWVASTSSVGWVELAPDDGSHFYAGERPRFYDCRNGIKTQSRIHSVKLTGLEPGTTYRYRVYATEIVGRSGWYVDYGRTVATNVYSKKPLRLTTLDEDASSVSFVMVNDIHGDSGKLEALLDQCDLDKTDMVLFVGDMVSQFSNEETVFGGFMDKAVELFASEKPMYYTRGNHETRGDLAYNFQDYFSTRQDHIYYMFRHGPVCFVALDCGEDKPDSDLEYSGINCYDQYRDEQAEWLRRVVSSEEFVSAPFRIVTCHMPSTGDWHGDREIREKFIPILNEAGVDVMLSGHTHRRQRTAPGEAAAFPIVVNSNDDVLQCTVTEEELSLRIVSRDGKVLDTMTIRKKRK